MRWQTQYVRSVVLAALPFQDALRAFKRRLTGVEGDAVNEPDCIKDGLTLIELVGRNRVAGATVLEIGSGWQPLIPLLFKQAGAARVIMMDAHRLMDEVYFERARTTLARSGHPTSATWQEFDYRAPCDWQTIPDRSVDIVWSRAVLEHIAPPRLEALLRTIRRVLKSDGVMAHLIDNSDHWEHKDKSISRVNFLKFGDSLWSIVNFHPLMYQNRLRHSDYVRLTQSAGFEIDCAEADVCARSMEALSEMRLARRYRQHDLEDLAAITSRIVARPFGN